MLALFPGQGSQAVGMGKDLVENFSEAREVFEEASDAIKINLKKLCFEGPESDLLLTENTQPCLLTASMAAYRVAVRETGFKPTAVAGHSLGEYTALVAAGALQLNAAVQWVKERGKAMQSAVPVGEGTMAAIMGLEDNQVEELCQKATQSAQAARLQSPSESSVEALVQPANFNAPGQVVIAGSTDAIQKALELVGSDEFQSGKAIPLSVSAPFHSALMKPARDHMAALFAKANGSAPIDPSCPYVPNRTARPTRESGVILGLLEEQIDHPVLWKQTMSYFLGQGIERGIEFGPGRVLAGLAKRIARAEKKKIEILNMGSVDQLSELEKLMTVH